MTNPKTNVLVNTFVHFREQAISKSQYNNSHHCSIYIVAKACFLFANSILWTWITIMHERVSAKLLNSMCDHLWCDSYFYACTWMLEHCFVMSLNQKENIFFIWNEEMGMKLFKHKWKSKWWTSLSGKTHSMRLSGLELSSNLWTLLMLWCLFWLSYVKSMRQKKFESKYGSQNSYIEIQNWNLSLN